MNEPRALKIELASASHKVLYSGVVQLEVFGATENGKWHRITIELGPSEVGYFGERLHDIVNEQQSRLDAVKAQLRGQS